MASIILRLKCQRCQSELAEIAAEIPSGHQAEQVAYLQPCESCLAEAQQVSKNR